MPSQCLLRGMPGTYTRADRRKRNGGARSPIRSARSGRRSRSLRVDAIDASISNQPGVSNFLPVGDTQALRVMPTVGLEYRYPFINVQPWGTTTIEPIAQIILRPNETYAGKLPNEDAQSMVFDASNLFAVDKFSGYDRVEGGGRANVGVQATTQFDRGGSVNVLFGQSYQLFGLNSFAVADVTNTGLDSGLQTTRSDYVARVNYSPNRTYTFSDARALRRGDAERQSLRGRRPRQLRPLVGSLMYGNYAAQPELGYLTRREGLLGSASIKVAANWVVSGAARWDLEANKINQYIIGAGYVDDCFVLAANYVTSYTYSAGIDAAGAQSCVHAADRPADASRLRRRRRQRGRHPVETCVASAKDICRAARLQFEPVDIANRNMTTTPFASPFGPRHRNALRWS